MSDRPFISVDELELMSPNERLAAVRDRVVTDLDELPEDFRSRIIATAQSLSDGPAPTDRRVCSPPGHLP